MVTVSQRAPLDGDINIFCCVFREAKQHCSPKSLEENITGIGKLKSVKCNCNGTKVSILCDKVRQRTVSDPAETM